MSERPKTDLVTRVRDNTRHYIEELLRENVRLRETLDQIGSEGHTLRTQLDELRADLDRREQQHGQLLQLLVQAESETRRFEDRFVEVEQQNASLAALYAASYQLHATIGREAVLAAIQEIVINLLGSEELAVLAVDGGAIRPLVSVGLTDLRLRGLRAETGAVGQALASVSPVFSPNDALHDDDITAAIPLAVDGRVLAMIVIFRLLPQKPNLNSFDRELCDLLATHAATALYCAGLSERGTQP